MFSDTQRKFQKSAETFQAEIFPKDDQEKSLQSFPLLIFATVPYPSHTHVNKHRINPFMQWAWLEAQVWN